MSNKIMPCSNTIAEREYDGGGSYTPEEEDRIDELTKLIEEAYEENGLYADVEELSAELESIIMDD